MSETDPRAARNLNPGNLRPRTTIPKPWPGQAGIDTAEPDPPYAKFVTTVDGFAALVLWLLDANINRGLATAEAMMSVFAPPSDDNPTSAYAESVANHVGHGTIELMADGKANTATILAFVQAIAKWESAHMWTPAETQAGIALGLMRWPMWQAERHDASN